MKRILSIIVTVAISFSVFSIMFGSLSVSAESVSGRCGEDITWELNENGYLELQGTGEMDDFSQPWKEKNIKKVKIGEGITTIGAQTFYACNMSEISLPSTLKYIYRGAFSYCKNISEIEIPKSVTYIDEAVFCGCDKLTSINLSENITCVGEFAFSDCSGLNSITIEDGAKGITCNAFDNTPYFLDEDNWSDNVLYIGKHLITVKPSIKGDYVIESGTKTISSYSFIFCDELTSVILPETVQYIGDGNFSGCSNLTTVVLPRSVTEIEQWEVFLSENLTLTVIENSYAHSYAVENNIPYVLSENTLVCEHTNSEIINFVPATCSNDGYSGDIYCTDCQTVISKGEIIPATGHKNKTLFYRNADLRLREITTVSCEICGFTTIVYGEYAKCDINCDGMVNKDDISALENSNTEYFSNCDFDGDNIVKEFDKIILKRLLSDNVTYNEIGDVNGDKTTDLKDLIRLKKITANATNDEDGDLDGNGNSNSNDMAFLQKFILVFDNRFVV